MKYLIIIMLLLTPACSSATQKYHGLCKEETIVQGNTEVDMQASFMNGCLSGITVFTRTPVVSKYMFEYCTTILEFTINPSPENRKKFIKLMMFKTEEPKI